MSKEKKIVEKVKRPRGRPKKIRTPEELAAMKKPKLTLAERQAIKLKAQKRKEAEKKAKGELEPKNKARFYCSNKELQAELIKWRDSNLEEEKKVLAAGGEIDYAKRKMSEELGKMLIDISKRILNHSNFRNYPQQLKEDMQGYFFLKIMKGLKNYNFQFNNPFAFITMAAFNAYLTVIGKHYKHINIRKELMKKMMSAFETYNGINPNTSLSKCIKSYLGDDIDLD